MKIEVNNSEEAYPLKRDELKYGAVYAVAGFDELAVSLVIVLDNEKGPVKVAYLDNGVVYVPPQNERFRSVKARVVVD